MAAIYLVTMHPGAPVPDVGFVRPGDSFIAPDGYVPSKSMVPLNEEAAAIMEEKLGLRIAVANVPHLTEAPRKKDRAADEGVALSQLGKMIEREESLAVPTPPERARGADSEPEPRKPSASKRAADR